MTEESTIEATSSTVGCDGGGGALGHPLVYLKIPVSGDGAEGIEGEIVCPYCSRHYVLRKTPSKT
ncbi:MAG: zinc-finger domain-containing protein [Proteobacteria bacterium]|nr:zinc-finger domain-containing protein [Pseudomonadota bacterium]MDA1022216.1 zinc-finger domain-containing protein [Pseudomonadota bacterium]